MYAHVLQVGDIVLCPGKWANQDMVGLVEATQFIDSRTSWNVDVIELNEIGIRTYGKTFSAWKKPSKTWFDVSEVSPSHCTGLHTWSKSWLSARPETTSRLVLVWLSAFTSRLALCQARRHVSFGSIRIESAPS